MLRVFKDFILLTILNNQMPNCLRRDEYFSLPFQSSPIMNLRYFSSTGANGRLGHQ